MKTDRRIDAHRVVIDECLFVLHRGVHARTCVICDTTIAPGEERYLPIRAAQRKKMVNGRRTRLCVGCVEGRIAERMAA